MINKLPEIKEKEFMQQIIDLAHLQGWLVYHTWDSRRSAEGFPDLVMVRGQNLIYAEVKREKNTLTDCQCQWIESLLIANQAAYVWRPSDWPHIVRVLAEDDAR